MTRTPPKVPRPWPSPLASSPAVHALGERPDARAVEAFWRDTAPVLPLVEPADDPAHAVVTFCWRDADAEQVLLFANRLTDETSLGDSLMRRVLGTDLWHLSYRMPRDWRASYSFVPHRADEPAPWAGDGDQVAIRSALDHGRRDPRNPDTCRNRAGVVQSVVSLPDAPPQPWLEVRDVPRGEVVTTTGPTGRTVWVHRPHGATDTPRPVVVALDGDAWTSTQSLPTILDNLVAEGLLPDVCALLVDSGDREARWRDLDATGGIDEYIVDELLPWARSRYGISADPTQVVVVGQSLGGLSALRTGLRHPGSVGAVVAQSASLWSDDLLGLVAACTDPSIRVHLEVGALEWVLVQPHRELAIALEDAGIDVTFAEFTGGHDYACWRGGVADALVGLWGRAGRPV
ncbi:MAG: enterochelin esterase [Aeromicrobium sp.]